MEHHAVRGHLRLELLGQVPGDGFSLTVRVRGQVDVAGVPGRLSQPFDDALFTFSPPSKAQEIGFVPLRSKFDGRGAE